MVRAVWEHREEVLYPSNPPDTSPRRGRRRSTDDPRALVCACPPPARWARLESALLSPPPSPRTSARESVGYKPSPIAWLRVDPPRTERRPAARSRES